LPKIDISLISPYQNKQTTKHWLKSFVMIFHGALAPRLEWYSSLNAPDVLTA